MRIQSVLIRGLYHKYRKLLVPYQASKRVASRTVKFTSEELRPMSNGKPLRSDHFPERRQTHKNKGHETSRPYGVDCSLNRRNTTVVLMLSFFRGLIFAQTTYCNRLLGRKQIDAAYAPGPRCTMLPYVPCAAGSRVTVRRVLSGRQRAWQSTIIQNGRVSGARETSM
ncbi:hypothetical protein F5Y05DRAFT_403470 [Hypoxylon sp. FL0543]|nr:hypothetical protein F5Y05DRAFT_403470 [Hypoxylon sp. FL0543]